ncbi:DgyrCDS12181 [Dimorphilus gyrociliatus]|uniref:DgyrCDS12181 n=1 Tax=Dimorphilus gyrociliatus TaxID=2664684 RepID=A0A7I8W6J4_9ANNE|nr:DgyrCDS12181 [Dimorphilus gyrociliatus]
MRPIIAGNSTKKRFLLERMPILKRKFWPTIWCTGYRLQTIVRAFLKTVPPIKFEREIIQLEDKGEVALDWLEFEDKEKNKPIVLILPGLIGSSDESYCRHFVQQAYNKKVTSVVFNYRGNGGLTLRTAKTYCATHTDDLDQVIKHIRRRNPDHDGILAAGISLGGLILTNYLAKVGKDSGLKAAFTVSAAWNVFESCKELEQPINWFVFNRLLAESLVSKVKAYAQLFENEFEGKLDLKKVWNARTIREFDDSFTCRQFGYSSYVEYYEDACIYNKLHRIKIPLLCLNAADDPFSPAHCIPIEEAKNCENVAIVVTAKGGHIGFMEGLWPTGANYMDSVFAEYINAIFPAS